MTFDEFANKLEELIKKRKREMFGLGLSEDYTTKETRTESQARADATELEIREIILEFVRGE